MEHGKGSLEHWRNLSWDERFLIWAHPVAIIADRYEGSYSRGKWIAIAGAAGRLDMGSPLLKLLVEDSDDPHPWAGDTEAMDFWAETPNWIAVGDTPDAALQALKDKNRDVDWPFKDYTGG